MDFSFTEEQQMLLDSTRRWVSDHYGAEQRKKIITSPVGFSREVWRQFADLGLLGINIPADDGGFEGGPVGTLAVSMVMGEALVVEPYLSSAVVATRAIDTLASPAQRAQWLPKLASGELIAVLAHDSDNTHQSPGAQGEIRATRSGSTWRLEGQQKTVYHAPLADLLLIPARTGGGERAELGLFAVPRGAHGLALQELVTVDGQRAAHVTLEHVELGGDARIGGDVSAGLALLSDYALSALCADALGALDKVFSMTVEYARTRVQFGQPIGRFQALQHRMADMLTHIEQARSMAYLAASRCESSRESERVAALSGAKVLIGRAARFVGHQAIQLHGGMGMTDELIVSHYFKRLAAFQMRMGSTEAHLRRYASASFS